MVVAEGEDGPVAADCAEILKIEVIAANAKLLEGMRYVPGPDNGTLVEVPVRGLYLVEPTLGIDIEVPFDLELAVALGQALAKPRVEIVRRMPPDLGGLR